MKRTLHYQTFAETYGSYRVFIQKLENGDYQVADDLGEESQRHKEFVTSDPDEAIRLYGDRLEAAMSDWIQWYNYELKEERKVNEAIKLNGEMK